VLEHDAGAVVEDGFLGQPFERGAVVRTQAHVLARTGRGAAGAGAVPLGRAGRGCQHLAAGAEPHRDVERVAADHAAGRMNDDDLAGARPFRVQRLLHPQRARMRAADQARGPGVVGEVEAQGGAPWRRRRWIGDGIGMWAIAHAKMVSRMRAM
jgi:hypothetical protein